MTSKSTARPSLGLHDLNIILFLRHELVSCLNATRRGVPYLPLLEFVLLSVVLLDEIIQDLLQSFRIGLDGGDHILDRPLHKDAVDQAEALSIPREGFQGLKNQPISTN